jgi:threonine/homoserine/homoserine lactone efflux protein
MIMADTGLLLSAALMGGASGFSPGPLSTLAISQTLKHGPGEGIKVCLAPVLTDLPVIAVAILLLSKLAGIEPLLGALSLGGAIFIFHIAYGNLTFRADTAAELGLEAPGSFRKGFWTSLLSPYAFLFWTSVGSSSLAQAWQAGPLAITQFIFVFYSAVLLAKACIVGAAAYARPFMRGRGYENCIRALGVLIAGFGIKFLVDGAQRLSGIR